MDSKDDPRGEPMVMMAREHYGPFRWVQAPETAGGKLRLIDFMPLEGAASGNSSPVLLREVEGLIHRPTGGMVAAPWPRCASKAAIRGVRWSGG